MSKTPLIKIPLVDKITNEIRNYENTLKINNSRRYICKEIISIEDYSDNDISQVLKYYPSSYFVEFGCYNSYVHRDIKRARGRANITHLKVKTIVIGKSTRRLDIFRPKNWLCC